MHLFYLNKPKPNLNLFELEFKYTWFFKICVIYYNNNVRLAISFMTVNGVYIKEMYFKPSLLFKNLS